MNFYDFSAKKINGEEVKMSDYKGKVVIVVNTASKCGLTPQFKELEKLYNEFKDRGFEILGFPCNQFAKQDPGTNEEILNFCQSNFGVTFTMFEKIDVNGPNTDPLYKFLKSQAKGFLSEKVKWNFTKFLIDAEGNVIRRYASPVEPKYIAEDVEALLVQRDYIEENEE